MTPRFIRRCAAALAVTVAAAAGSIAAPAYAAPTAPIPPVVVSVAGPTPPPVPAKPGDRPAGNRTAPKGKPGAAGGATKAGTSTASLLTTTYSYALGRQTVVANGIGANLYPSTPYLAPGDFHSLTEVTVQSADSQQIIEAGWTKDPALNGGSTDPHLFVYWWKNGAPQCYNGCGWVDYAPNTMDVGDSLIANYGTSTRFIIQYSAGNWWVAVGGAWVGYYPDTLWSAATPSGPGVTFTQGGFFQAFGEVASSVVKSCTDMGNGYQGTAAQTLANRVGSIALYNTVPATAVNFTVSVQPSTLAGAYDVASITTPTTTFRFGGAGHGPAPAYAIPGSRGSC